MASAWKSTKIGFGEVWGGTKEVGSSIKRVATSSTNSIADITEACEYKARGLKFGAKQQFEIDIDIQTALYEGVKERLPDYKKSNKFKTKVDEYLDDYDL